jgi:prepilin peptidase CpaA
MFTGSPGGLIWGALFSALLLAGSVWDVRARRIPNSLVLAIIAGGLSHSLTTQPAHAAVVFSFSGLMLGFAIWIVFYLSGAVGAGDVKFFSAAGTWLGPSATWRAALVAGVVGGVLAVFFLLRERRLVSTIRRMTLAATTRSVALLEDSEVTAAGRRHLPYGVALAAGALLVAWLPHLVP